MKINSLAAVSVSIACVLVLQSASVVAQSQKERNAESDKPAPAKEAPEGYSVEAESRTAGVYPGATRVRGSAQQSVAAGERFLLDVWLNRPARSDTQVTLKVFRVDLSGVGSGDVQVLPIVMGSAPGEEYWDVQPMSPFTIPRGRQGYVNIPARVLANAKQPPAGMSSPFEPVQFPDHLIFIAETSDGIHTQTVRVRKP